ncbi:TPA: DUF87 domain-containing protein [Bacillus thuringiensis]|nr:DUF87 domain-containing protein [Bacillus thuringiensis]HDR8186661.1 DUF87 domain-containing protein [Bacillus thuringiensis]
MFFEGEINDQAREEAGRESKLMQLMTDSDLVGFSFDVNYQRISFVTNDFWKMEANGISHNSFLIATPFNKENYINTNEIDKEIILLRVVSECKIPNEDLWLETKVDKIKSLKNLDFESKENVSLDFDKYSKNEMGFTGLDCRILGTFYENQGRLNFGADLENYYGTKSLYIYKPKSESLQKIINFIDPMRKKSIMDELKRNGISIDEYNSLEQYEIGTIRYTSTNRMQAQSESVKVFINPFDFIARRTATFGMTRTGKSNTVKTLIKAISKSSEKHRIKVAQIVFDVNGEYAFPNVQDSSVGNMVSIAKDIPNSIVYTLNSKVREIEDVKRLKFNFYSNIVLAHEFIVSLLNSSSANKSTDIESFVNMDVSAWSDQEAPPNIKKRTKINKSLYQYLLYLIGCEEGNLAIKIPFSKTALEGAQRLLNDLLDEINGQIEEIQESGRVVSAKLRGELRETTNYIGNLADIIANLNTSFCMEEFGRKLKVIDDINRKVTLPSSSGGELIKDEIATLMNIIHQKNSKNSPFLGYISIKKVQPKTYHDKKSVDYVDLILSDIKDGRAIIIDISNGAQDIRDRITKKIVEKIFYNNLEVFTNGDFPPKVILYVEEAHNLIGKDMELTDIWPRTAKEGAKYGIGLVYSTQEPSSINKNILSNTENWFITHLNNEDEIRVLSKFYDFGDFRESLLRAKDIGFARIKTMSQNFVTPVQIKKFEGGE